MTLLAQRATAGALGAAVAGVVLISTQRLIWGSAADICERYGTFKRPERDPEEEMLVGPKIRGALVRRWNQAVDSTLGELAAELARRGL
jgi:hypothetical protein